MGYAHVNMSRLFEHAHDFVECRADLTDDQPSGAEKMDMIRDTKALSEELKKEATMRLKTIKNKQRFKASFVLEKKLTPQKKKCEINISKGCCETQLPTWMIKKNSA